jgi:hypothetical protein
VNKWNILLSLLILLVTLFISYHHSVALFELGGFEGVYAHLGVISAELTFLQGAMNIIIARLQGKKPGAPATMAGLLGLLLVGLSNVMAGIDFGIIGIVLGAAVPVALLVSESMLAKSFLYKVEEKNDETVSSPPTKKVWRKRRKRQTPPEVMEWVENFYKEKGVLPTRIILMKELQLKEWTARQIVKEFKTKVSVESSL